MPAQPLSESRRPALAGRRLHRYAALRGQFRAVDPFQLVEVAAARPSAARTAIGATGRRLCRSTSTGLLGTPEIHFSPHCRSAISAGSRSRPFRSAGRRPCGGRPDRARAAVCRARPAGRAGSTGCCGRCPSVDWNSSKWARPLKAPRRIRNDQRSPDRFERGRAARIAKDRLAMIGPDHARQLTLFCNIVIRVSRIRRVDFPLRIDTNIAIGCISKL